MHPRYLVAIHVAICDHLTMGAVWFSRQRRTRMTVSQHHLHQPAGLRLLPVLPLVEQGAQGPFIDVSERRRAPHEQLP